MSELVDWEERGIWAAILGSMDDVEADDLYVNIKELLIEQHKKSTEAVLEIISSDSFSNAFGSRADYREALKKQIRENDDA